MAFVHIVTCVQSASPFFYFKITFEFLLVIVISQDHEFYFRGQGTNLLFLSSCQLISKFAQAIF